MLGRPPKRPIGERLLIRIHGDEGPPVWAKVVRNTHRLVVEVTTNDPVWRGARLHEQQFREVRLPKLVKLYRQVA